MPRMQSLGKDGHESDDDSSVAKIEEIDLSEATDVLDSLDPEQTEKYLMELMGMLRKVRVRTNVSCQDAESQIHVRHLSGTRGCRRRRRR